MGIKVLSKQFNFTAVNEKIQNSAKMLVSKSRKSIFSDSQSVDTAQYYYRPRAIIFYTIVMLSGSPKHKHGLSTILHVLNAVWAIFGQPAIFKWKAHRSERTKIWKVLQM